MKNKIVYLGSDHAGFGFKGIAKEHLLKKGYEVVDFGAYEYNENDDYPDFLHPVAQALAKKSRHRALIFGGSGMGESILLNRYRGVRCGVWHGGNEDIIANYREHDDINALAIASRFVDRGKLLIIIDIFLDTQFIAGEKYKRRLKKLEFI